MTLTRRNLFFATAASLLPRLNAADMARMIVRSERPQDLEMPLDAFKDWITPSDRFFIRCHTYFPERANLADWKLQVDGVVNQPVTLTMAELKKLPRVELVGVLECAGNGRSFYRPRMPGAQWDFGSVGNARWAGVRFRDVLQKAGLKDSAKEVLLVGADSPIGTMPKFQRTITVQKAMDPDTLLAYDMNGSSLPHEHGFPLRVIASGWAGDSWVKWLHHVEVLDHEFDGFWMKTAYRHPPNHIEPGTAIDASQMVPVTDLNVKSVIATPNKWAKPGKVTISGTAWSNSSPVAKVEVSVDGGSTWTPAKLGKDQSRYAWRLWQYEWNAPEGKHSLIAKATNAAGQSQPMTEEWNPSGYLWNVAQPVDIVIAKDAPLPEAKVAETRAQPPGYKAACMVCHDEKMMEMQHITRAQWDREVTKMTGWGAQIKPEEKEGILKYLADHFKL